MMFIFLVLNLFVGFQQTVIREQPFLKGKLVMNVPSSFTLMDREMRNFKYPQGTNMEVFTDELAEVNVYVEQKAMSASKENLGQVLNSLRSSFQANPTITLEYSKLEKINGRDFIRVKFTSLALDVPVYNEMAVTYLDGKTLICGFNCILTLKEQWIKRVDKIITSIRVK